MATDPLTGLEEALRQLVHDLTESGVGFALVGGLAVSTRAEPRLTRDADVAVSVRDDREAESLIHRMLERGYSPGVLLEHDTAGRLATVRLTHRDRPEVVVDVLFASCGIEPEIVELAEDLEVLPGLIVPVAEAGHLIAMKLLARDDRRRAADADDLRALAVVANGHDWDTAKSAVRLITTRGYNRDRDLEGALVDLHQQLD